MSCDSPFFVTGPAVLSISGGRTSGYMLWRILQAHGGVLPADVVPVFANTGREMPATLDFVQEMSERWGVRIVWLEYRRLGPRKLVAEEVGHNSAARNGEPFDALIQSMSSLPTPARRSCTMQLKILTMKRWAQARGWKSWTNVVGIRADEPRRLRKVEKPHQWHNMMPLAEAGATLSDVTAFWRGQPFDLRLAGKWEGNCDGCFMKSRAQLARMFRDHPERMAWWEAKESISRGIQNIQHRTFHKRDFRPTYRQMAAEVLANRMLPLDETMIEGGEPCGGGCGI